ncbi:MFS transporter [Amycolatopsis sp. NPDC098790]|uniref:MFS transporter n=1 Tax=Amycolatopsis sp. NPDC098790 TaxID=3363939 RepID=UPI00380025DA
MTTTEKTTTPAAALLGFFVVTLDAVIVNVALPAMRADLGGGITGLQWVVDGYTLMFAAFLLSAGALSDRIGAKRAFGLGVGVFAVTSLACGVAPVLPVPVVFRFLQGTAAAMVMPSSMALIAQAYPDPVRRGRAVAAWAMGGAVASSAGPVLGGLLTTASWRWIFLINVPVSLVAAVLLPRSGVLNTSRQLGGALAVAVFGALLAGPSGGDTGMRISLLLAAAMAAVAAFAAVAGLRTRY